MESEIPQRITPITNDLTPPPSPFPVTETPMEFQTLENSSMEDLPPPFKSSDPKALEKSAMEDLIQSFSCSSPEIERPNEFEVPIEDDFLSIPSSPPLPESNHKDEAPISSMFSPFLFPETDSSKTMMGAGLVNLGNTCFLNVILQCFTHTVPFVQSLRSCNHSSPCQCSIEGFCVICTLRDHIECSLSSSGRTVSPYQLVNNLSYISSSFRRNEQEDAHEFLQSLLDKLDSSSVDVNSNEQNSSKQEESFVNKIYGGGLKSKLRCSNCGHCSDTFENI
ncbi:ubiquitinyl hydrolase 1 [Ranunculus cassubicifolius]